MSQEWKNRRRNGLPLPSPRSPRELDEKILAHARAKTPAKSRSPRIAWAGGVATASVLVVAVYLGNMAGPGQDLIMPNGQAVMEEESFTDTEALPLPKASRKLSAEMSTVEPAALPARSAAVHSATTEEREKGMTATKRESMDFSREQSMATTTEQDTLEALQQLRDLFERGEVQQARTAYAKLKVSCEQCDLPETLEQALADSRAE